MKIFADLLYLFLKSLVWIIYRVFYSKMTIINEERLRYDNPSMVLSNHPSTLMDPLSVGVNVPGRFSFLANAGLFRNPVVGAFLNIYCIPIERPKDVDGRRINNENAFVRADECLYNHGCIYVAAEGTSVVERRLRKIKTGSARIALSAESKKNFELGVTILPVGLTYSAPLNFRSKVLLNVGQPIELKNYKSKHAANPIQAVKTLTSDIQKAMEDLVFHTETDEEDQLLWRIQEVLQSEKPQAEAPHFLRSKKVLDQLLSLDVDQFQELKSNADNYFDALEATRLEDPVFSKAVKEESNLAVVVMMILGFPFFLYGWINNLLGFGLPGWIAHRLKIYHGYIPTVKTMGGLIFIPLFYILQSKAVEHFFGNGIAWIYLLTLLPMAWIAWKYYQIAEQYFKDRFARRLKNKKPKQFESLLTKRTAFVNLVKQQFPKAFTS